MIWAVLPLLAFLVLLLLERWYPARSKGAAFSAGDWMMNLTGFIMQGLVIPAIGYFLATLVFPVLIPGLKGCLQIGVAGSFILNFVGIDFLYYLQHRAFHQIPWMWKLHAPHHYSPTVNVWATSRNAIVTNFFFVYLLVNPIVAFLCSSPEGFFAGSMVTAALDLFRHANLRLRLPLLDGIILMPHEHHRHHDAGKPSANYGANLIVWDKLFGTHDPAPAFPEVYAEPDPPPVLTQLLCPWR